MHWAHSPSCAHPSNHEKFAGADDDDDKNNNEYNNSRSNAKNEINNLHLIKLKMQTFCTKFDFFISANPAAASATECFWTSSSSNPYIYHQDTPGLRIQPIINITFFSNAFSVLLLSTAQCILCDSRFGCKIFTISHYIAIPLFQLCRWVEGTHLTWLQKEREDIADGLN